ncbi:hypothetical protein ACJW30_08G081400 [Castanea mollissima]
MSIGKQSNREKSEAWLKLILASLSAQQLAWRKQCLIQIWCMRETNNLQSSKIGEIKLLAPERLFKTFTMDSTSSSIIRDAIFRLLQSKRSSLKPHSSTAKLLVAPILLLKTSNPMSISISNHPSTASQTASTLCRAICVKLQPTFRASPNKNFPLPSTLELSEMTHSG